MHYCASKLRRLAIQCKSKLNNLFANYARKAALGAAFLFANYFVLNLFRQKVVSPDYQLFT